MLDAGTGASGSRECAREAGEQVRRSRADVPPPVGAVLCPSGRLNERVAMTQTCCPACRLRIPRASGFASCPSCGGQLRVTPTAEAVGLALFFQPRAPAPADVAMVVALVGAHDPRS